VNELDHFQKILSLNKFVLLFSAPVIALVLWYMSQQTLVVVLKEKVAFGLFITFLLTTFTVSFASYLNRSFLRAGAEQVNVQSVQPEFSSMYGITYDDMMRKIPSRYRIYFNHNNQDFNRPFKKNPCDTELDNLNPCFIVINKGALGFEVIKLDNK